MIFNIVSSYNVPFMAIDSEIKTQIAENILEQFKLVNKSIKENDDLLVDSEAFKELIEGYYDSLVQFYQKEDKKVPSIYEQSAYFLMLISSKRPLGFCKKFKYRTNETFSIILILQSINSATKSTSRISSHFITELIISIVKFSEIGKMDDEDCIEYLAMLLKAIYCSHDEPKIIQR